jgi:WD40 repeat protein
VAYNTGQGVQLWDVLNGKPVGPSIDVGGAGTPGTVLAFSPDGRRFATNIAGSKVRLWDANTAVALGEPLPGHDSRELSIVDIAFGPEGHVVLATAVTWPPTEPGSVLHAWNADTNSPIWAPVIGNYGVVLAVAFSPDGSRIVTGGADRMVRLWDAGTGQPSGEPIALQDQVSDVAFTERGERIVAVSGDTVQIFDADPDAKLVTDTAASRILQTDSASSVFGAWPTIAGPRILVRDDNGLRLLNADTGERVGPSVDNVRFNAPRRSQRGRASVGNLVECRRRDPDRRCGERGTGRRLSDPAWGGR